MSIDLYKVRNKSYASFFTRRLSRLNKNLACLTAYLFNRITIRLKQIKETIHQITGNKKPFEPEVRIEEKIISRPHLYEVNALLSDKEKFTTESFKPENSKSKMATPPREVKPGSWLEAYDYDSRATNKLKLSVILIDRGCLVFVNHFNIRIMEKDIALFSDELAHNKSRIISDHSFFDKRQNLARLAAND